MRRGINEVGGWMKKRDDLRGTGSRVPIIRNAFARERIPYGEAWRLYLEAEDPDGDMERIAVVVHQIGYGSYPTDWIVLKDQYRSHLIGYLQWNTFSSKASHLPERTCLTVRVSIFDRAKNESNEVIFPFTFESGVHEQDEDQLPYPFNPLLPCIGHITVDLLYEVR